MQPSGTKKVCVMVLGELGCSPRMLYHGASLARMGHEVHFVGFAGARPHADILAAGNVQLHELPPFKLQLGKGSLGRLVLLPIKALYLFLGLLWILLVQVGRCQSLLVQTPMAIPALPLAAFVSWCWAARLVVDWHNLGYTLFDMSLRPSKPGTKAGGSRLVNLYRTLERYYGGKADIHLTVTDAMANFLQREWKFSPLRIRVLHDRPGPLFRPLGGAAATRSQLLLDIASRVPEPLSLALTQVAHAPDNHKLLITGTSWTADEDFSVLLRALEDVDKHAQKSSTFPRVVVCCTGKGDLRAFYEEQISQLRLLRCSIHTVWLQAADYPRLLSVADLGVSLHQSSSGLDLPMKVLDMFGSGIPVCARRFECIGELVRPDVNGVLFSDHAELTSQLIRLFSTEGSRELSDLKSNALLEAEDRWEPNWQRVVASAFV
jgi:beta-1,4-mannosyltransferase